MVHHGEERIPMVTLMCGDAEQPVTAFPQARRGNADLDRTAPFVDGADVEALDQEILAGGEVVHGEVQCLTPEAVMAEECRHDAEGGMDPCLVPRHLARYGQGWSVAMTRPVHATSHRERDKRGRSQVAQRTDETERRDSDHDGFGRSPVQPSAIAVKPRDGSPPRR